MDSMEKRKTMFVCLLMSFVSLLFELIMGSCCVKQSSSDERSTTHHSERSHRKRRPRTTTKLLTNTNCHLICLDTHPTAESSRLKTRLKGQFGFIVCYNRERILLDILQLPDAKKFLLIVFGHIEHKTLEQILDYSNVLAIYFYSNNSQQFDHKVTSHKIKGTFYNESQIEKSIRKQLSLK